MVSSERAEAVVRDYYDALRDGDPLGPYFLRDDSTVKFGISESLFGEGEIVTALEEQTEATANWSLESRHLVVAEWDGVSTFADEVTMAWTDTERGDRHRFDSRWSGTLVEQPEDPDGPNWRFAVMHVSASTEI
ncbi:nuclear transport factor 2 family protein [Natrinema halophilum]|uniref:DUF3225 domain-containing protein n=1 Tax=Natrinema halophilum TaxID=1699371 RepID=A0A7D5H710_9EURY|nr:nuclear transport factor 2 family protein [Natrinema halophilum]QLG48995.1 DUF3225 domain-containing protein [Natrinema halophilum]